MTDTYSIYQDCGFYDDVTGLQAAIDLAEELLGGVPPGEETTFTVEKDGYVLASVTNRRIVGLFTKQQWGGPQGNDAIFISEDDFDATDAVLLMTHEDLLQLNDHRESAEELGRAHVSWAGPCTVAIEDAVMTYFGVEGGTNFITPEALAFARNRANPQEPVEEEVTLSVKLKLRVTPGSSVTEFIENLDYNVTSNTVGVTVANTEIVDAS